MLSCSQQIQAPILCFCLSQGKAGLLVKRGRSRWSEICGIGTKGDGVTHFPQGSHTSGHKYASQIALTSLSLVNGGHLTVFPLYWECLSVDAVID